MMKRFLFLLIGIILYNINPKTWNCLYPFYELNNKFTIDDYSFNKDNSTYEDKRKIGANSYNVFYYIIEQQMKVGVPIIAESNFVKESIATIKDYIQ